MKMWEAYEQYKPKKVKISGIDWWDDDGNRKWSAALTDAQILAYCEQHMAAHVMDERDGTLYCILRGGHKRNEN